MESERLVAAQIGKQTMLMDIRMFSDGKKSVVKGWDAEGSRDIVFNASGTLLFRTRKYKLEVVDILLDNWSKLDSGQRFHPLAIAGRNNDKLVVGKCRDSSLNIWASMKEKVQSNISFDFIDED